MENHSKPQNITVPNEDILDDKTKDTLLLFESTKLLAGHISQLLYKAIDGVAPPNTGNLFTLECYLREVARNLKTFDPQDNTFRGDNADSIWNNFIINQTNLGNLVSTNKRKLVLEPQENQPLGNIESNKKVKSSKTHESVGEISTTDQKQKQEQDQQKEGKIDQYNNLPNRARKNFICAICWRFYKLNPSKIDYLVNQGCFNVVNRSNYPFKGVCLDCIKIERRKKGPLKFNPRNYNRYKDKISCAKCQLPYDLDETTMDWINDYYDANAQYPYSGLCRHCVYHEYVFFGQK